MRFISTLSTGAAVAGLLLSVGFLPAAQDQNDQTTDASQTKETQARGMPPRVAVTEYLSHGQAGSIMIGAEFDGHSIPTPEHTFSSEDYIVVEAAFFGPPGAHLTLSRDDFSLRVTGRKMPLPSEPFELVMRSLKDPEWQPPESSDKEKQSKGGLTGGTNGDSSGGDKLPPLPPKMPFPLKRAMELQVQKSMMEQGDRPLPQAGLLFFRYGGKAENIKGLELLYSGAAGKATIELQP